MVRSLLLMPLVSACTMSLDDGRYTDAPAATYDCAGGERFSANFLDREAWVTDGAGRTYRLKQRPAGSGFSYEGDGAVLRGKGALATWTPPRGAALECESEAAQAR